MPVLLSYLDTAQEPRQVVDRALAFVSKVKADRLPVLYGAPMVGEAIGLGRHQVQELAINPVNARDKQVVRRVTGGPSVAMGEGMFYVALVMPEPSAFMACPRDRILNRNVRGLLSGLSQHGVFAHYFGRDFISVGGLPCAFVGWHQEDGAVVIESVIGLTKPIVLPELLNAYPSHHTPRFLGKPLTTLSQHWPLVDAQGLFSALQIGHAKRFGLEVTPIQAAPSAREAALDLPNLTWGSLQQVPIGFVTVGISHNPDGSLDQIRLVGDFFQDIRGEQVLQSHLVGQAINPRMMAEAINQAFGARGYVMEGVHDLSVFLRAMGPT